MAALSEYRALAEQHDQKEARILVFNAAFDRFNHRFGKRGTKVLAEVARAVKVAEIRGWQIVVAAHKTMDRDIEPYLDIADVSYITADLTDAGPNQIIEFYAQCDFVIGMRGHAQMIPFGLRRPILSIISHDKMRFLLEDIERTEWGVEVDALDLVENVESALDALEKDRQAVHSDLALAQQEVWAETSSNFQFIADTLDLKKS